MKLANAKLYEEQIKNKMLSIWYEEKYQYYFGGQGRQEFSLSGNNSGGFTQRAFAVLNDCEELIGYISYSVDTELEVAMWFGAINFSEDKFTFGQAIHQVIYDCFVKFGINVVEWCVICGNPIEKSYDRMCKKFGGRIVGVRRKRAKDLAGNLHDDKIYEIEREDFFRATQLWINKSKN